MMIKTILKNTSIYGFGLIVSKFLLFLSIPIFTRLMSVESYGIVGFIMSLVGVVGVTMKIGTNNAVQRYYFDVESNSQKNIIVSGLHVLIIFSAFIFFSSLILAFIFNDYFYSNNISFLLLVAALAYIFLMQFIVFIKDIMRLHSKPWLYFFLEVSPVFFGVSLALLLIYYQNLNIEGYFLGYFIGTALTLGIVLIILRKEISYSEKSYFKKKLITYGYPFIFVGFASWVFQSADRWMLLELSNAKEVGLYTVAYQLSSILIMVVTVFGIVWGPSAIKLLKNEQCKNIYASVGIIWYLTIAYISFAISLFFNNFVEIVLDKKYYASIEIGLLLIATVIFIGTIQMSVLGISLAKKTTILPWITSSIAVLNIILNYYFIPELYALGAAIATLISNFLLTLLYYKYSQKFYHIPYNKSKLFGITLLILLFFMLLFFTDTIYIEIIKKGFIFLLLSLFFIVWIVYEIKQLMPLVGSYEK